MGKDMKEETGIGIFIKMNTETGLVKCIEKMIERIVEKKLMKETEDTSLGIDISQVMIDWKNVNRSHGRSPSSSMWKN